MGKVTTHCSSGLTACDGGSGFSACGDAGGDDVGCDRNCDGGDGGCGVCGNCGSRGGGSVTWLHYSSFDPAAAPDLLKNNNSNSNSNSNNKITSDDCGNDVFIAWRYSLSLSLSLAPTYHNNRYLWLHDLVDGLPEGFFDHFGGVFVQSAFHRRHMIRMERDGGSDRGSDRGSARGSDTERDGGSDRGSDRGYFVVPNGLTFSNVINTSTVKNNSVFIYGSAPNRGLLQVLEQWPAIKAAIPTATLEVYYGFSEAVQRRLSATMGSEQFEAWFTRIKVLLGQNGVVYVGPVGHKVLQDAYERSGWLLYPTTFRETGCISVLRAMAAGCIPITSRLQDSVLEDLTEGFDMGPVQGLLADIATNATAYRQWLEGQWTPAVIAAHRRSVEESKNEREVDGE